MEGRFASNNIKLPPLANNVNQKLSQFNVNTYFVDDEMSANGHINNFSNASNSVSSVLLQVINTLPTTEQQALIESLTKLYSPIKKSNQINPLLNSPNSNIDDKSKLVPLLLTIKYAMLKYPDSCKKYDLTGV